MYNIVIHFVFAFLFWNNGGNVMFEYVIFVYLINFLHCVHKLFNWNEKKSNTKVLHMCQSAVYYDTYMSHNIEFVTTLYYWLDNNCFHMTYVYVTVHMILYIHTKYNVHLIWNEVGVLMHYFILHSLTCKLYIHIKQIFF